MISNYAINPTPEQALRSNRAVLPARVIAALDLMATNFARTNVTDLSDDELVICDFLWPYQDRVPLKLMYKDIFPDIANLPYSHSIPDKELEGVLDSLVSRGILDTEVRVMTTRNGVAPYPHRVFWITQKGGMNWERERTPNWQLYVRVESDGDNYIVVSCLSEEIGRKFLEAQSHSGFWQFAGESVHLLVPSVPVVPWREFDNVHKFRIPIVQERNVALYDRASYEAQRIWWSCTHELIRDPSRFQIEI